MWITNLFGFHRAPKEITLRCDRSTFAVLRQHWQQDPGCPQLAFGLAEITPTAMGVLLRLWDLFLPSPLDLVSRTLGGIIPTRAYQSLVYLAAEQTRLSIVSFQATTTIDMPALSEADRQQARQIAAYVRKRFSIFASVANVVFNQNVSAFQGELYQRDDDTFRGIDRIEILGRPSVVLSAKSIVNSTGTFPPDYDGNRRNPAFERYALQTSRVSLIGLSSKGSHVLPMLVEMGVGTKGWIAGIDPGSIYSKAAARTPYPSRLRQKHVEAAAAYVRSTNRAVRFQALCKWLTETAADDWFKASTLAIVASDSVSVREAANCYAIRYGVPLVDLGSEVLGDCGSRANSAQVRVVIPGETGCSVCQQSPQSAETPFDASDPDAVKRRLADAYLHSLMNPQTPALANLDALKAACAVNAVLAIILGSGFGEWDELRFCPDKGVTVTARIRPRESCPVCGFAAIRHPSRINAPTFVPNGLNWVAVATDTNPPGPFHGDPSNNSTEGASHA